MGKEIRLAFIWHMHQPDYRDPSSSTHMLPWVRLHSLRGYSDVVSVTNEFPFFKQTINFSPVLIDQIIDISSDLGHEHFFELSRKPADELTEFEQDFILRHFFFINWDAIVKNHPRYNQLLLKRGLEISGIDLSYVRANFTTSDFRDLVMLFNLMWCGFSVGKHELIRNFIKKERGYSEEDKLVLLDFHREVLDKIIPTHAELYQKGKIELTCTPENHPILPLLINSRVRDSENPDIPDFRCPEDARRQIIRGKEIFKNAFGKDPDGMWPSEGSISQEAVEMIQSCGFKWIAADEALLLNESTGTIVPKNPDITHPWLIGNPNEPPLYCFFRNRGMSDDIGFKYSKLSPADAVDNFIRNLENIASEKSGSKIPPLVVIVCDGENPWEYYPDSGEGFLKGLAQKLETHPFIKTTTPSEYLSEFQPTERVSKIGAGSWINADFGIWMGSPEDKKAWELLRNTRLILDKTHPLPKDSPDEIGTEKRRQVLSHLWVAEGSDWFWWYGEPYSSPMDYIFDLLFRRRLKRAYEIMNVEPPVELLVPLDPSLPFDNLSVQKQIDIVHPEIDGHLTTFYEWHGAGHLKTSLLEGLVARKKTGPITDIFFSADESNIFLRLDYEEGGIEPGDVMLIRVIKPSEINIAMDLDQSEQSEFRIYRPGKDPSSYQIKTFRTAAVGEIIEIGIPIDAVDSAPLSTVCFSVFILRGKDQIDRIPLFGTLSVTIPDEKILGSLWRV